MTNLLKLSFDELSQYITGLGGKSYRAAQIFESLHQKGVNKIEDLTNLSKGFRAKLLENKAFIAGLEQDTVSVSSDGTRKYRFKTADGHYIESVFIPNASRPGKNTICISSQVGCAMGCKFCATAAMKLQRNLCASEIASQVYLVQKDLYKINWKNPHPALEDSFFSKKARLINNIVYMGMGEPLHNFDEVKASIFMLCNDKGQNYSARRITVSTSGVVKNIARLSAETDVMLAVSLNATENKTRSEIMPVNQKWPIEDLFGVLRHFKLKNRDRITFEYVLLKGVNDFDEDAIRLAKLIRSFQCKINLIPFNEHPLAPYKTPDKQRTRVFKEILERNKIDVFVRQTRGDDVDAACGMLGAKKLEALRVLN